MPHTNIWIQNIYIFQALDPTIYVRTVPPLLDDRSNVLFCHFLTNAPSRINYCTTTALPPLPASYHVRHLG